MKRSLYCGDCGTKNPAGARYCNACGLSIVVAASVAADPPASPAVNSDADASESDGPATHRDDLLPQPDGPDLTGTASEPPSAAPKLLWWTIPADSLLHGSSFRALMLMRLASETALNALTYGMLVEIVRRTESGFQSALVTVSTVAPAALFGLLGGSVVDRANKRVMLVVTNLLRAAVCAAFLLTSQNVLSIYALLIGITIVTQFTTPAESAIIPRVVAPHRLAAANSFANLAESVGQVLGMAMLAPLFIKLVRNPAVLVVCCGAIFAYAGLRALAIRPVIVSEPPRVSAERRPWLVGTRESLLEAWAYLSGNRPAFITMLLLVLAGTANLVMVTLAPRFTQEVLELNPESAVYVFGPAVLGLLGGLALVPRVVHRVRPRVLVLLGFLLMVLSLLLIGVLDPLTRLLRGWNVLWLYGAHGPFGTGPLAHADGRVGTMIVLAIPLGFSFAVVQISANTFLHARVPLPMQGRVFALQGAIRNATAIVPLLALGGLASLVGVRPVLIVAPLVILLLALYGASKSGRWVGVAPPSRPEPSPPAPLPTHGAWGA